MYSQSKLIPFFLVVILALVGCGGSSNPSSLQSVQNAATNNDASTISVALLNSIAGVSGAVANRELQYQSAIAARQAFNVDTAAEIQALINSINALSVSLPISRLPVSSLPVRNLNRGALSSMVSTAGSVQTIAFSLSADQEVETGFDATINTGAQATATIMIDTTSGAISGEVVASGLDSGQSITGVHLHAAFAGASGGIIEPLVVDSTNPLRYVFSTGAALSTTELASLLAGGTYINLHTTGNTAGQLRGQVVPANIQVLFSNLEGAQQNPPVTSSATGRGYLTVNTSSNTGAITANVSTSGFTPTVAHIHSGFAGENGPVIITLNAGTTAGSFVSPAGAVAQSVAGLLSGNYYFNVHSSGNPSGEVRGQLAGGDIQVIRSELQSSQQNPAVVSAASGVGYLTVNTSSNTGAVTARVSTSGFTPTAAHIHSGFAGENGPIVITLEAGTGAGSFVSPTGAVAQSVTGLLSGNYYFNVHSSGNPGGEVRGQLAGSGIQIIRSELQSSQENPPVVSAATGIGYLTVNTSSNTGAVTARVSTSGFTPTAAHIHSGFAGQNGPVIITLQAGSNAGSFVTSAGAMAQSVSGLLNGNYYFNVHSSANSGGELRGQLAGSNVEIIRSELQGDQENPVNSTTASGVAYMSINTQTNFSVINANVDGFAASAAHIHDGFAGSNGAVVLALSDVSLTRGATLGTAFSVTSASSNTPTLVTQDVLNGRYYVNVHDNNPGEVRGQIAGSDTVIIRSILERSQEVPSASGANPNSTGRGYITVAQTSGSIRANANINGFVPTVAHIHQGRFGATGNPIITLNLDATATDGADASFSAPANAQAMSVTGLLNGNYYFNVHSAANPAGEVRGQILPSAN